MDQNFPQFQRRVSRIERSYANRVPDSFTMQSDGLVVPKTRRQRLRFRFPLRALITGLILAVLIKGFLIFFLGEELYAARVAVMLEGSTYDQLAAKVLLPEAASLWVAEQYHRIVAFMLEF